MAYRGPYPALWVPVWLSGPWGGTSMVTPSAFAFYPPTCAQASGGYGCLAVSFPFCVHLGWSGCVVSSAPRVPVSLCYFHVSFVFVSASQNCHLSTCTKYPVLWMCAAVNFVTWTVNDLGLSCKLGLLDLCPGLTVALPPGSG